MQVLMSPLSSVHFQIGIWAPKQHFFSPAILHGPSPDYLYTLVKGPGEVLTPVCADFKRSFITCFLGQPITQLVLRLLK